MALRQKCQYQREMKPFGKRRGSTIASVMTHSTPPHCGQGGVGFSPGSGELLLRRDDRARLIHTIGHDSKPR